MKYMGSEKKKKKSSRFQGWEQEGRREGSAPNFLFALLAKIS